MTPMASSAFIPQGETGGGVLSSSPSSLTGFTPILVVPAESSFASGDALGAKHASWTRELDSTVPDPGDCCLGSGAQQVVSAESLNLSNSSDGAPTCRICFFGDEKQPLLDPCNCRGTIAFMHRDCLERWIQRTMDPQCQVCHFRFTVRKQPEPAWRVLSNGEARRPVLRYMALGDAVSTGQRVRLHFGVVVRGEKWAATVVVFLAVQNILWFYFPFVSFRNSYRAYKKWREETATLKLVLNTDPPKGAAWPNFSFWRSGGGSREPVLADGGAQ
ncbi:hypothetical protein HPB50_028061 [Hyalomma asiaticum]|nr:hypothetical protein HPB50_028061 [Hyalomma asiaticum]